MMRQQVLETRQGCNILLFTITTTVERGEMGWYPILKWGRNVDTTYTLALTRDLRCTVTVPMVCAPTSWWWTEASEGCWATLSVITDSHQRAEQECLDDYSPTHGYQVWMARERKRRRDPSSASGWSEVRESQSAD